MFRKSFSTHSMKFRVVLAAAGVALAVAGTAAAQTAIGPHPSPPPSYGPPVLPALQGYELGQYSRGFNFRFTAALTEIQQALPAGYTAVPSSPGATTGTVTAIFGQQTFLRLTTPIGPFAAGTYGPFETFDLAVGANPPPGSPYPLESVFLARFVNNAEIADIRAAIAGSPDTRFADIVVRVIEGAGELTMRGRVVDADSGFRVAAALTGPAEVAVQLRQAGPLPLRTLDTSVTPPLPGAIGVIAVSAENSVIFTDPTAVEVTAQALRLPSGRLFTLGVSPGNFFLNQEVFYKKN